MVGAPQRRRPVPAGAPGVRWPAMTASVAHVAARDGTDILVRHWPASGERPGPWATLLIVHGLAEHSGRYDHVGRFLAAAGIDANALDLRGFGGSGGRRP